MRTCCPWVLSFQLANHDYAACIGLNLARMELRLCTALFFRAFPTAKLSTKFGMSDSEMEPQINFLVMPKGHRCLIEV